MADVSQFAGGLSDTVAYTPDLDIVPQVDIFGAASSPTVKAIMLDNHPQSGSPNRVHAKFYNSDGSDFVAGTTKPDMILPVEADESYMCVIAEGAAFSNGITMAASEDAGDVLTTNPTQSMACALAIE